MMILVTGTAGFIGFSLARRLLMENVQVAGVDNLNDYYSVYLKEERHRHLGTFPGFFPNVVDLCDYATLKAVFEKYRPELVCHLAAQAGVRYSLENPLAYQRSNMEGFANIIELSRLHGVKRFVYASSSSVYGGVKTVPFRESECLETPLSLYAATKKANELVAHSYSHIFGMQTAGLRFFTVYGPWGRPDMAMWIFTDAIMSGRPINVFNHGDMRRDFTYIDDIVEGIKGALFADGLPAYSVFNLGNNRVEDLMHMIELLENSIGKKAVKRMLEMQAGDIRETYADISLASRYLGYAPKTNIEYGIPRFVEWYLTNPTIADKAKAIADR